MRRVGLLLGAVLTACNLTTEPIERVEVTLAVAPREVQVGDSVRFTATAFNPTDERIQIGHECGPSFDVHVTLPDGEPVSVLREVTKGAFTCELASHHFVEPGEMETLRLTWPVPRQRGRYRAVTGFRRANELDHASAAVEFVVE